MESWCFVLLGGITLVMAVLVFSLLSMVHSLREMVKELDEKRNMDTNTPILVSSGSRTVRRLAAQLNRQLQELRKEHLKLQYGDMELKTALTNASHDLRTPLTAICGYLDLLEQEELSERQRRYLVVIRERTDTMRLLTEELLTYSVMTGTANDLNPEPVNINDVLEQSLAGFYGALSGRNIVPEIHIPEEKVVRLLDAMALRRVFDNIIGNAVRYSDGDLTVRLTPDGTVMLENSTRELDCVQTERLFDRFYTVRTASGSTGLGLSIAKTLTERMNGQITAEYRLGRLLLCIRFPEKKKEGVTGTCC